MKILSLVERALADFDFEKAYRMYVGQRYDDLLQGKLNSAETESLTLHLPLFSRFKDHGKRLLIDVSYELEGKFRVKGVSGGTALSSGGLYAIGYYHADTDVKVLQLLYAPVATTVRSNDVLYSRNEPDPNAHQPQDIGDHPSQDMADLEHGRRVVADRIEGERDVD